MKYSTRFAHLEQLPKHKTGDTIMPNDIIGTIGSTGMSEGVHLHIDTIIGHTELPWYVSDCENGFVRTAPEQTDYCVSFGVDNGLFLCEPVIEACYHSYDYYEKVGQRHWGTDVTPSIHGMRKIRWNRSMIGTVLYIGFDKGYGYSIIIGYEV